jgi:hypothetical protein
VNVRETLLAAALSHEFRLTGNDLQGAHRFDVWRQLARDLAETRADFEDAAACADRQQVNELGAIDFGHVANHSRIRCIHGLEGLAPT